MSERRPNNGYQAANCGLLLAPVIIWNLLLWRYLPPAFAPSEFSRDIPTIVLYAENTLRLFIFAMPFFMPIGFQTCRRRIGFRVYWLGMMGYFASWIALIKAPGTIWATSAAGFMAPAYTPIIWLTGIALIGSRLCWVNAYRWWVYWVLSVLFVSVHVAHTAIVFARHY